MSTITIVTVIGRLLFLNLSSQLKMKVRLIKCIYTKHLTKKRKLWNDGILKIINISGSIQCELTDALSTRGVPLETRQLDKKEIQKFRDKEDFELEFENYIISVSQLDNTFDNTSQATAGHIAKLPEPPLKLPKFIPPSRYIPPSKVESFPGIDNKVDNVKVGINSKVGSYNKYQVTSDELDDIWGNHDTSIIKRNNPIALSNPSSDTHQHAPHNRDHRTFMHVKNQSTNHSSNHSAVQPNVAKDPYNNNDVHHTNTYNRRSRPDHEYDIPTGRESVKNESHDNYHSCDAPNIRTNQLGGNHKYDVIALNSLKSGHCTTESYDSQHGSKQLKSYDTQHGSNQYHNVEINHQVARSNNNTTDNTTDTIPHDDVQNRNNYKNGKMSHYHHRNIATTYDDVDDEDNLQHNNNHQCATVDSRRGASDDNKVALSSISSMQLLSVLPTTDVWDDQYDNHEYDNHNDRSYCYHDNIMSVPTQLIMGSGHDIYGGSTSNNESWQIFDASIWNTD